MGQPDSDAPITPEERAYFDRIAEAIDPLAKMLSLFILRDRFAEYEMSNCYQQTKPPTIVDESDPDLMEGSKGVRTMIINKPIQGEAKDVLKYYLDLYKTLLERAVEVFPENSCRDGLIKSDLFDIHMDFSVEDEPDWFNDMVEIETLGSDMSTVLKFLEDMKESIDRDQDEEMIARAIETVRFGTGKIVEAEIRNQLDKILSTKGSEDPWFPYHDHSVFVTDRGLCNEEDVNAIEKEVPELMRTLGAEYVKKYRHLIDGEDRGGGRGRF